MSEDTDAVFAGSVPEVYDRFLVPLIFEEYAADAAGRVAALAPRSVLEVAAGTGVLTRALCHVLDEDTDVVATDLHQAMLDRAEVTGTRRPVSWRQADVMELPFAEDRFDVVVCQFSAMFFPDRSAAAAEIRRVLRPGGVYLFSVWRGLADNEFADVVTAAAAELFPDDPPMFLARTPHGHHDETVIADDLHRAGFGDVRIERVDHRSLASSADLPAIAYCRGTPLRDEIERRSADRLDEVVRLATERLAARFGSTDLDGRISALVVEAHAS